MSLRQDLKIELEDFLRGFSVNIEKYLDSVILEYDDDYVSCDDCGHDVYINYSSVDVGSIEMAETIFEFIHDRIHTPEDLKILADAGDIARQILNKKSNPTPNTNHAQFDDAMKGMS